MNTNLLAGMPMGRKFLARLIEAAPEPPSPVAAFLDFGGVTVATASFLREGPVAFRDWARTRGSNLYPVIANASETVLDELTVFLDAITDAMLACSLTDEGAVRGVRLIGTLEEKQHVAFDLMVKERDSTAVELARISRERVGPTTWNNRLAALAAKGLLMESSLGRTKQFKVPV